MSFSRFGANGSDVYTYKSSAGLECCGCILYDGRYAPTHAADEFRAHMDEHRAAGHTVPEAVYEAMRYYE